MLLSPVGVCGVAPKPATSWQVTPTGPQHPQPLGLLESKLGGRVLRVAHEDAALLSRRRVPPRREAVQHGARVKQMLPQACLPAELAAAPTAGVGGGSDGGTLWRGGDWASARDCNVWQHGEAKHPRRSGHVAEGRSVGVHALVEVLNPAVWDRGAWERGAAEWDPVGPRH